MAHFKAGAYRMNISPPLGICMEGGFSEVRARDVWDDLYANALVLDDGQTEVAFVSVDVCSIDQPRYLEISQQVHELTGIPAEHVIVTATHTHSGPATGMDMDGIYTVDREYANQMIKKIASAVRLAQLRKEDARLFAGRGANHDYVFNRRLIMPDGTVRMNWVSREYTQGARGDGIVDPEVIALKITGLDGKPFAFVVNYANHNNAGPGDIISADYAGVMGDCLRAVHGSQVVTLFLPGPAGNVNWLDHWARERDRFLYRKIGQALAGTVLEIEGRMENIEQPVLKVQFERPIIPERPYVAYDILEDYTFGAPEHNRDFFDAYQAAYQTYKDLPLPEHEVDLHVVNIGEDVALCTNPAELFVEFGMEIKRRSPRKYTLVSELTNGLIGYVATRQAFAEGGYEVRKLPGNSFMAVETGERIVDNWERLLRNGAG